jgi:hypothetical protein
MGDGENDDHVILSVPLAREGSFSGYFSASCFSKMYLMDNVDPHEGPSGVKHGGRPQGDNGDNLSCKIAFQTCMTARESFGRGIDID